MFAKRLVLARLAVPATWAAILIAAGAPAGARADLLKTADFNIAAQALADALVKYSEQSGVQVTSAAELIEGKKSHAVVGSFPVRSALELLLNGTGLAFDVIGERTVAINAGTVAAGRSRYGATATQAQRTVEAARQASDAPPGDADAARPNAREEAKEEAREEEIVVTASRTEQRVRDVPASVAVVDFDRARRDGFTYGTDEFRGVTGVYFRRGEGDGDEFPFVSIRGSTGTDGYLAMIDGVPLIGAEEEPLQFLVPYDALERIEIVKGPASALYGRGALYGAVNYLTQSPGSESRKLSFGVGSDSYFRAQGSLAQPLGSVSSVLVSAAYENAAGWREHGGRKLLNLFAKLTHELHERATLTAYANYSDRDSQFTNGLPLDERAAVIEVAGGREAFLGYGDPGKDQQVLIGALRLDYRASDALSFAVSAQGRGIEDFIRWNFYDPLGFAPSRNVYAINGYKSRSQQEIGYLEATANWRGERHDIVAGISAERGTFDDVIHWSGQSGLTSECGFAFFLIEIDYTRGQIANRNHPCFLVDELYTKQHFTNDFFGAFVQDQIRLTEQLYLSVGGRYDRFRRVAVFDPVAISTAGGTLRAHADAFSPKASLSWRYDAGQVYFTFGRGFNSNFGPMFEWDASQFARPRNKPTTLDSYELGWKAQGLDSMLALEAALFFMRQKNRRTAIPNPDDATDPAAPGNLITFGQLYVSRGAEVSLRLEPTERTSLTLNYSYIEPEWKDRIVSTFAGPVDLSGTTPVGVPRHIAYFAIDHRFASWLTARMRFEAYDDYMITQDNRVEGGSYELLTVGASIEPPGWSHWSLDFTVTNALDEDYYFYFGNRRSPTYAMPGIPRQIRATLRADF